MSTTYKEIRQQPDAWRSTIPAVVEAWARITDDLDIEPETHIVLVGSGSSLYIARSAAQTFQEITGHVTHAVPSSEVFLSPATTIPLSVPVLAFIISRSGSTSEGVLAAKYLREKRPDVDVVSLTCVPDSVLEKATLHTVCLPHAAEQSVVMTRSFSSMLLALQTIAGCMAENQEFLSELARLPNLLDTQLSELEALAQAVGKDLAQDQFIYLGLGPNNGIAEEATLKLKEMTQTNCEAYNPLEFRHGPISMVHHGTTVVLLEGMREREYMGDLEADLKGFGAHLVVVGPYSSQHADAAARLAGNLSDTARCILYLPALQLMAYYRAIALDLNPDQPRNLTQIVVLSNGDSARGRVPAIRE